VHVRKVESVQAYQHCFPL